MLARQAQALYQLKYPPTLCFKAEMVFVGYNAKSTLFISKEKLNKNTHKEIIEQTLSPFPKTSIINGDLSSTLEDYKIWKGLFDKSMIKISRVWAHVVCYTLPSPSCSAHNLNSNVSLESSWLTSWSLSWLPWPKCQGKISER